MDDYLQDSSPPCTKFEKTYESEKISKNLKNLNFLNKSGELFDFENFRVILSFEGRPFGVTNCQSM